MADPSQEKIALKSGIGGAERGSSGERKVLSRSVKGRIASVVVESWFVSFVKMSGLNMLSKKWSIWASFPRCAPYGPATESNRLLEESCNRS